MTEDLSKDLEELTATYAEPDPLEEFMGEFIAKDPDKVEVRIFKWNGGNGYHWEVKFPKLSRHGRKDGDAYWGYDRYSGYAMTKWGAQWCVNQTFKKRAKKLRYDQNQIQYQVSLKTGKRVG
jgi:hypothetical protein